MLLKVLCLQGRDRVACKLIQSVSTAAEPGEHVHQPRPRPAAGHRLCAADRQTDANVDFQHLSTARAPSSLFSEDLKPADVNLCLEWQ